jgi:hypothetical protein
MPHLPIQIPEAPAQPATGILKVKGNQIVGNDGKEIFLKGAGIGGQLNMENCT